LAEYIHFDSMGQEGQFVASPAARGFLARRNWERVPELVIVEGACGGAVSLAFVGEQRSQRRTSMSWQDFVRREGAEVSSLLQFPLGRRISFVN
jgi:hypothetical protein